MTKNVECLLEQVQVRSMKSDITREEQETKNERLYSIFFEQARTRPKFCAEIVDTTLIP